MGVVLFVVLFMEGVGWFCSLGDEIGWMNMTTKKKALMLN